MRWCEGNLQHFHKKCNIAVSSEKCHSGEAKCWGKILLMSSTANRTTITEHDIINMILIIIVLALCTNRRTTNYFYISILWSLVSWSYILHMH